MSRRKTKEGGRDGICIDEKKIEEFIYLIYFYKANAVSILTSGEDLYSVAPEKLVKDFNSYVQGVAKKKVEPLDLGDFGNCVKTLSSDEIIEMKEYLKSSAYLRSYKTSETFKTTSAIDKLASAANRVMSVRIGDVSYVFIVDLESRDVSTRAKMGEVNREFHRLVSRDMGFTEAYILASSIVATKLSVCEVPSRVVLIRENFYTSLPLSVVPLCRRREFANFYIDLVQARSEYREAVASALLIYLQTRDEGRLYEIIRNMTQTQRLKAAERSALTKLASRIDERVR
ncbi:MAG: hypothetical protein QXD96_08565 [Pyrobaculum sp.]